MTARRGRSATATGSRTVTLEWPAAQATLLDARGAIDALTHRREQLEREIVALLPSSPWARAGRPVALPARDRHADRGRAVRRDRRLRTVRPRRAADELRRAGPVRVTRPGSSAGSARSPRPAPGTPADCWSRPPGTTAPAHASAKRSPTARTASPPKRSRSPGQRATTPAPHLDTTRGTRQTPHDHRRRRRPRTRRLLLGDHPHRVNRHPTTTPSRRLGRWRPGNARGTRDTAMSNPPPRGWPRPILDSGSPRRTMVLRYPTRAYQPDRASRTACRTATHPADHTHEPTNAKCEKSTTPA